LFKSKSIQTRIIIFSSTSCCLQQSRSIPESGEHLLIYNGCAYAWLHLPDNVFVAKSIHRIRHPLKNKRPQDVDLTDLLFKEVVPPVYIAIAGKIRGKDAEYILKISGIS